MNKQQLPTSADTTVFSHATAAPRFFGRSAQPSRSRQGCSQSAAIRLRCVARSSISASKWSRMSTAVRERIVVCEASRPSMSDSLEEVGHCQLEHQSWRTISGQAVHQFAHHCRRWDFGNASELSSAFLLISLRPKPLCKQCNLPLHCFL